MTWTSMAVMALVTFLMRYSFIGLGDRLRFPPLVRRALRLLPAAVLPALVVPAVILPEGVVDLSPANPRLLAALVGVGVAWKTRSMFATMLAGLAALWLLTR